MAAAERQAKLRQSIHIADAETASPFYEELAQYLREEWPQIQSVRGDGRLVPEPLVALTSDGKLAGGLSFLAAESPPGDSAEGEGTALWINAVLVLPARRQQGVGGRLIQAAQLVATQAGIARLHALTEIPDLYRKQGWTVHSVNGADYVMTWVLAAEGSVDKH